MPLNCTEYVYQKRADLVYTVWMWPTMIMILFLAVRVNVYQYRAQDCASSGAPVYITRRTWPCSVCGDSAQKQARTGRMARAATFQAYILVAGRNLYIYAAN